LLQSKKATDLDDIDEAGLKSTNKYLSTMIKSGKTIGENSHKKKIRFIQKK